MSSITVSIQSTKNPSILKFTHTSKITNGSYEYNNIDDAKNSPITQQLFHLPFVKKIFVSANFIAIEKYDIVTWDDVQEEVREQIEVYLNSNDIIIDSAQKSPTKVAIEIYAETTPNPAVMKFVSNKMVASQTFEFKDIDEAKTSPIAVELFKFPFENVSSLRKQSKITKFDCGYFS
jgi:hypothetical protein